MERRQSKYAQIHHISKREDTLNSAYLLLLVLACNLNGAKLKGPLSHPHTLSQVWDYFK